MPIEKRVQAFFSQKEQFELVSCNSNSSFFKSDTIKFYNNINYFYQSNECCEFIKWEFYKLNKIAQTELKICKEPSTAKVRTENDYFEIKLIKEDGENFIVKKSKDKKVQRFKILGLSDLKMPKDNNSIQMLTIVKVR